jgi:hypothetical protein
MKKPVTVKIVRTAADREALAKLFYKDWMLEAFDDIERAQMEFKKNGGKVTVVKMRKPRKAECLIRVGVKY